MSRKTFVISDTFFGRKTLIKARKFSSVDEMDSVLVNNWNKVVGENDIVYHLGNFAWTPAKANEILGVLNGEIRFILGEYDAALLEVFEYFESIEILPHEIFKNYENKIVMSHWPLLEYPNSAELYNFHGNCTSTHKTDLTKSNRVNCCADWWNLTPIEIETTIETFNCFKKSLDSNTLADT